MRSPSETIRYAFDITDGTTLFVYGSAGSEGPTQRVERYLRNRIDWNHRNIKAVRVSGTINTRGQLENPDPRDGATTEDCRVTGMG